MAPAHNQKSNDNAKILQADPQDIISVQLDPNYTHETTTSTLLNPKDTPTTTEIPPHSPKRKLENNDVMLEINQDLPKKRKVTFATSTDVCSDCDIDILRQQSLSSTSASDASRKHANRALLDTQSRRRCKYKRRSSQYVPGTWAVSEGGENVNTSGCVFKNDFAAWEHYVKTLKSGAMRMEGITPSKRRLEAISRTRAQRMERVDEEKMVFLGAAVLMVAGACLVGAAVVLRVQRRG